MSPTMTEGGIATWKKQAGEAFSAGDVLLEIETDKATMDVEAQDDGVMAKIVVDAGAKNVPVNSVIAVLGEEGDDLSGADALAAEAHETGGEKKENVVESETSASRPESSEGGPESQEDSKESSTKPSPQEASPSGDRIFASPLARKLAQEQGIALSKVTGSGPNGRIVKSDIENFKPKEEGAQPAAAAVPQGGAKRETAAVNDAASSKYTDTPVTSMRKVIAGRLTESKQQLPHYYVSIDVEMDKVLRLRALFNEAAERQANGDATKIKESKLSVGDFITKAAAVALKQVPDVNAAWYGDFIRQYHTVDISIAVATPTGLITPIVADVGGSGLATISASTKSLASRARQGKLQPHEYQGGSFTISNMGMFGISHFTAIINPPQGAILAIGGTEPRVVVDDSEERGWRKAMVMQATISADHRIIDGATAARWMKAFKDALENPLGFML
jgi:pyruvate dehydrogenase E2 component (dihydrolipoamide acetyltransferase)